MGWQIDLRAQLSLGRHALDPACAVEVAAWIREHPRQAGRLIELLWDDDAGVANRAADVLERVSIEPSPTLRRVIADYKGALLGLLPDARFIKLRWNLAFVISRPPLTLPDFFISPVTFRCLFLMSSIFFSSRSCPGRQPCAPVRAT